MDKKLYITEKFDQLSKFWLGTVFLTGSGLFLLLLGCHGLLQHPGKFCQVYVI